MRKDKKPAVILSQIPPRAALLCGAAAFLVSAFFSLATFRTDTIKEVFFYMFFFALATLWAVSKTQAARAFCAKRFIYFLPLMLYVSYNIISFLFNPYKLNSLESFAMNLAVYSAPLFLMPLLSKNGIETIGKFFTAAIFVSYIYGALQVFGLDIMDWAGFYGKRVFGTQANPNFFGNFLAFSLFWVFVNFLKTKEKKYLFLLPLGMLDLFFTESKGAWVAVGAGILFFSVTYVNFFAGFLAKKHKVALNAGAVFCVLCLAVLTLFFAAKRKQSVDFRMITWDGVMEMAAQKPIFGWGAGSFKTIYPKFRRPEIFYIENIHNNETAHAENEYLEVLAEGGAAGLTLFLIFIFSVFASVYRKLKSFSGAAPQGRAPPESYTLFACACALFVILVHSFFDIDMRLASTAFFYSLFISVILYLSKPYEEDAEIRVQKIAKPVSAVCFGVFAICALWCLNIFARALGSISESGNAGRLVLWILLWGGMLYFICLLLKTFYKIIFSGGVKTAVITALSAPFIFAPVYLFQSDKDYSLALYYVKNNDHYAAAKLAARAFKYAPFNSYILRSKANMLYVRNDLQKTYEPALGDKRGEYSDDFSRVRKAYLRLEKQSPNETLLHYDYGALLYSRAYLLKQRGDAGWRALLDESENQFKLFLELDPVFDETYINLARIEDLKDNFPAAREWLLKYFEGPKNLKEKKYLEINKNNQKVKAMLDQLDSYS